MKRTFTIAIVATLTLGAALWAADEITVNTYLKVKNGYFEYIKNVNQLKRDQTGTGSSMAVQNIQTNTHELLVIAADAPTNGYAFFRNVTDNTDYAIDVGGQDTSGTFIAVMRLEGGDIGLCRLHPTTPLYALGVDLSGTNILAGVDLEYWINED